MNTLLTFLIQLLIFTGILALTVAATGTLNLIARRKNYHGVWSIFKPGDPR